MKLTGADSPWLTLTLTWQSPNFMFDTSPGLDIEVPAIMFDHCDLALMTVNERIGYLTQLTAVCHWYIRSRVPCSEIYIDLQSHFC